jgi:fumarate hydratase subunit beta
MTEARRVALPLSEKEAASLRAGQAVLLSGVVFTARDAAHQRLARALQDGEPLPFNLEGQALYYCGPAPTPPGRAVGSAGPTTSSRLDPFTPLLYSLGLRATIGKGERDLAVRQACRKYGALYLVAVGGAGALLADCVTAAEVLAYPELGPEAIRRLVLRDLPVIVAYDSEGNSVFPGDEPLPPLSS